MFHDSFPIDELELDPDQCRAHSLLSFQAVGGKSQRFILRNMSPCSVLVHIALYGHPPPRISDRIMGNLGRLTDWFIEENFSYIRVFGCSVPPHALPRFLPDQMVCKEVA
jgi:hypothetical protein